jgi:DNA polymerase-3 subunit epsilon
VDSYSVPIAVAAPSSAAFVTSKRIGEALVYDIPFVAVDLETTGSTPPADRIIEIGAAKIENFKLVGSYRSFVNPCRSLPPFITRLTGIAEEDLIPESPSKDVLPSFLNFLGDAVIVAHHAPFDHKFLSCEVREMLGVQLSNPVICTCKLARRILHFLPSKGLDAVTQFLGIHVNGRHRALGDAEATAKIFVVFLKYLEEKGITTFAELLAFQEKGKSARASRSKVEK